MKVKIYAHTTPEAMFKAGKCAGLTDEAAESFRYTDEFELELEVAPDGTVMSGRMMSCGG